MAEVTIRATPNGPYLVEGNIDLFDKGGRKFQRRADPKSRCAGAALLRTNHFVTALTAASVFKPLSA
jgi:hypothetical protein